MKKKEILFFVVLFLFSFWLMFYTFSYQNSTIYLSGRLWSDFAAHLPLIRSFSLGSNFPPEYPLFPGEPIRYHFLFYLLVGLLERSGLPLDWALNLPSALSFFALLVMIYLLAKQLFQKTSVAVLSVIFFLFNGTFSFLYFLRSHPFPQFPYVPPIPQFLNTLFSLKEYPSFMPYGPGEVTAFWSLNTFINQRHLSLAFAILLFAVYSHKRRPLSWLTFFGLGLLLGTLPFLNGAVFVMAVSVFGALFVLSLKSLKTLKFLTVLLSVMFLVSLPQLYLLRANGQSGLQLYTGYLTHGQGIYAFARHWVLNLGLHILFIPLGFLLAPQKAKQIFLAFFSLFLIGNLFSFSPAIATNHKFFNLFIIVGNMYSAYALITIFYRIFSAGDASGGRPAERAQPKVSTSGGTNERQDPRWRIFRWRPQQIVAIFITTVIIFFLTFSGLIDFFPLKNAPLLEIADYPKNPEANWIFKNTSPNSVFLNSSFLYHPASLAGRKIYLGWLYFVWGAGYQTEKRVLIMNQIYASTNKQETCRLLTTNKIDYFTVENIVNDPMISEIKVDFFKNNFVPSYSNPGRFYLIYDVKLNCSLVQ